MVQVGDKSSSGLLKNRLVIFSLCLNSAAYRKMAGMSGISTIMVIFVATLTFGSGLSMPYENTREGYKLWANDFKRETSDAKFEHWLASFAKVKAIKQSGSWDAALTKFADMSETEFHEKVLMRKESDAAAQLGKMKARNIPKSEPVKDDTTAFDWRDFGAVTPVQDQGFVGTCWAFSTVANVEGQYFLATNTSLKLSEEFLVDCDGTADYDNHHADCSIYGGWPYLAYQYLVKRGGIPSEESVPYCAGTGDCYPCMAGPVDLCGAPPYYCDRDRTVTVCSSANLNPAAVISDWGSVDSDEEGMMAQLQKIGPLSALLDAGTLQFYQGGVWTGSVNGGGDSLFRGCSKTALNHAILITGYGVDEESGLKYWSVKNSWGQDWGEEGYFRILRGEGECGINTAVTTAII